jgi:23S rRNA pseudouridine2605 synthase
MLERLQKIISRAGIASRRHAEQLILSGAVTVNGRVVTELGTKADAGHDHITVGPRVVRIQPRASEGYFAFYKPAQVVCTLNDPEGRPCLGPYVRGCKGRLFPIGRLEFDAAGLLLLTSDGELASDLMRAAAAIAQTWRVKVKGRIPEAARQAVEREAGVRLRLYRDATNAWYEATVRNAPRDLLRQSLLRQRLLVEKVVRSAFAGIELGSLAPGEMRALAPEEVNALRRATQGCAEAARESPEPRRHRQRRSAGEAREGMARAVAHWRSAHRAKGKPRRDPRSASRPAGRKREGRRRILPEGQGSE